MKRLALLLVLMLPTPAWAPPPPPPPPPAGDGRYQTLAYDAETTAHVSTAPDAVQTLLLAPDELIRSVQLSDPNAYLVIVAGRGDSLSFRANGPNAFATMTVQTDQRHYSLELAAGPGREAPAVVRFTYGMSVAAAPLAMESISAPQGITYRLAGNKSFQPAGIKDDGSKTYISWRDDQAIPAIFAVSPSGAEEMVDGYVRGGLFTIDHVYEQLIFRIDRQQATARRIVKRDRHARP
jgi:type IV secretion system protein VirB9